MSRIRAFLKHHYWLFPLFFIVVSIILGFIISKYIHTYLFLWLIVGFAVLYSLDKWFDNFTKKHKFWGKLYRLILNCSMLFLFGIIVYSGIQLFTKHFLNNQLLGSILFVIEIILFIWLWKTISKNSWRWPSMKLTVFSIIVLFLISSFAGIQPMAEYKDTSIEAITELIQLIKSKIDVHKAQERAEVINELSNLGVNDPTITFEELSDHDGLQIAFDVLILVNTIRKARGSPELQWDDKLYEYSILHAENMASQKRLFHSSMYESYAENAWGGEGSKSWSAHTIVDGWMTSDMHRTWLLCPHIKNIGIGVAYSDNGMYAAWTFWRNETIESDWWYVYSPENPPDWWY